MQKGGFISARADTLKRLLNLTAVINYRKIRLFYFPAEVKYFFSIKIKKAICEKIALFPTAGF